MSMNFNRYSNLGYEGDKMKMLPFVKISESVSDKYEIWNSMIHRYELLSDQYYGSPFYDVFLYYGNPEYLSEYDIPDGTIIRIPFPLNRVKTEFENFVKNNTNDG